jgi:hypothetical protein
MIKSEYNLCSSWAVVLSQLNSLRPLVLIRPGKAKILTRRLTAYLGMQRLEILHWNSNSEQRIGPEELEHLSNFSSLPSGQSDFPSHSLRKGTHTSDPFPQ